MNAGDRQNKLQQEGFDLITPHIESGYRGNSPREMITRWDVSWPASWKSYLGSSIPFFAKYSSTLRRSSSVSTPIVS